MSLYPPSVAIPVYAVFTAVGILLTGLRFWVRLASTRQRIGPDDWLILTGVLITCACTAIQFYNALHGTGGEAISAEDEIQSAIVAHKINYIMVIIEKPAFGAIKLSLLFFYRRIFRIQPSFRVANNVLIAVIILWTVAFVLADLLLCGTKLQLSFAADQSLPAAHCGDKGLVLLLFAVTSFVTDALVMALPLVYIRGLQMPKQRKWGTASIFVLGCMSTVACVLRMIFLCVAYPMGRMDWDYVEPPESKTPLVLQVFNPTFWVMVEMCLGTWAANLPALGPVLQSLGVKGFVTKAYRKFSSAYSHSSALSRREKHERSDSPIPLVQRPGEAV